MQKQSNESIKVVNGEYSAQLIIKRSRFIATIKGELDQEQALEFVRNIKKKYYDATHNCYAFIADELGLCSKFSDDGEPSGTAGAPMLEVLKRQNLKKTAVVVTRYFGGIKLGAGGLVGAYTQAVTNVLDSVQTREKVLARVCTLECSFSCYSKLEPLLTGKYCQVVDTKFDSVVSVTMLVRVNQAQQFIVMVNNMSGGEVKIILPSGNQSNYLYLNSGEYY